MLHKKDNEHNNTAPDAAPRAAGKLSEIIYSCSTEKRQTILLSNSPDESNQLLAEAIHDLSTWADKQFFVISCLGQAERNIRIAMTHPLYAELPGLLSNDELLEPMRGGTVMVTDPTGLSLQQQKELMRLLQDKLELKVIVTVKYLPQYSELPILHDIKFVKAPSLRNNSADISFAVNYFLSKANLEWSKNVPGVTDACLQQLLVYPWPGQLPQLREAIRQAAFFTLNNEMLDLAALPHSIRTFKATDRDFLKEAVKQAEYEMIYKTLRETNNNKRKTAEILKISRKTLYSKINMYKINNFSQP